MRMGGSTLLKQSIHYVFTHRAPWILFVIALIAALIFAFFVEGFFNIGAYSDYWYAIPPVLFRTFWQIWLVRTILFDLEGHRKQSLLRTIGLALIITITAWWLVGWLLLLEWASVLLLREPSCYSDSIDLAFFFMIAVFDVLQVIFNFFIFPMIANGERSFKKIILDACRGLLTHIGTLFVFFILFFLVALATAALVGLACSLVHMVIALFVSYSWMNDLFKALWLYSVNYGLLVLLGAAQAIFYTKHHKAHVVDKF